MKNLMLIGIGATRNQFWQQISVCSVDKDKKLQNGSNIQLPMLKVASESTIDIEITKHMCYWAKYL
jgi:hypothetical protein